MRWLLMAILSIGLASCTQPSAPTSNTETSSAPESESSTPSLSDDSATTQPADEPEMEASAESVMTMRNVALSMSDDTPTGGELQEPTFLVEAESGRLVESTGTWSLQGTRSTIYREEEDDLLIEAAEGTFSQESMTAMLQGDVKVTTGTIEMELSDLMWNNETHQATSKNPARVTQGDSTLQTGSLLIDPDKDELVLRDVSGLWKLKEMNL